MASCKRCALKKGKRKWKIRPTKGEKIGIKTLLYKSSRMNSYAQWSMFILMRSGHILEKTSKTISKITQFISLLLARKIFIVNLRYFFVVVCLLCLLCVFVMRPQNIARIFKH